MSKTKFAAAKELIDEKNFEAARVLLETIDHPQAERWLSLLDEHAPPIVVASNRAAFVPWLIAAAAVIISVISLVIGFMMSGVVPQLSLNARQAGREPAIQRMFEAYCAYPVHSTTVCNVDSSFNPADNADVSTCFVASGQGQNVEIFIDCMNLSTISLIFGGS